MTIAASAVVGRFWKSHGAATRSTTIASAPTIAGDLRARAGRLGDGRAARAAADREAADEAGDEVGDPEPDELAVRVDAVAVASGERAREHARVRERHESDADGGAEEGRDVGETHERDRGQREAAGHRADDADTPREPEHGDRDGRADHGHENGRHTRRDEPTEEHDREACDADGQRFGPGLARDDAAHEGRGSARRRSARSPRSRTASAAA